MDMKKIYKAIAKQHGVSVSEVERDMQAAIDETYNNPNWYARCVYFEGDEPTQEEFIAHIVRRVLASGGLDKQNADNFPGNEIINN